MREKNTHILGLEQAVSIAEGRTTASEPTDKAQRGGAKVPRPWGDHGEVRGAQIGAILLQCPWLGKKACVFGKDSRDKEQEAAQWCVFGEAMPPTLQAFRCLCHPFHSPHFGSKVSWDNLGRNICGSSASSRQFRERCATFKVEIRSWCYGWQFGGGKRSNSTIIFVLDFLFLSINKGGIGVYVHTLTLTTGWFVHRKHGQTL